MLCLQLADLLLRCFGDKALTVQFPVRARVRLVAGRHQVGGNVAFRGDIGHDLNFVVDVRQLREELSLGIAFQNVLGDGVARLVRGCEPVRVGGV